MPGQPAPVLVRLLRRLEVEPPPQPMEWLGLASWCWVWTGYRDRDGYGRARDEGGRATAPQLVHRLIYERLIGPIPAGLEPDHLCRRRACANPFHLEPVSHVVNLRRGAGFKTGRYSTDRVLAGPANAC